MCIIVDANAIHDLKAPTEHGVPVLKWLLSGKGGLIVGGKQRRELAKSGKMRDTMQALDRAGKLHKLDDGKAQAVSDSIKGKCVSDDPHVIAVALMSGCRLIFSGDKKLHKDAQNHDILTPAASIYQTKDHQHLLKECRCPA